MMEQLPKEISYGTFKPRGFYTTFKQWPITPLSSNQYWTPDQIVRFLVTIKGGVMDPYRSHIQFMVSTNTDIQPVGALQVDSSAQSFIAQTVVSSNNVQIERISQYDTLAAYLTDIGFSEYVCQCRSVQGLGFSNISSHQPYASTQPSMNTQFYNFNVGPMRQYAQTVVTGCVMPTRAPLLTGKGSTCFNNDVGDSQYQFFNNTQVNGYCGGIATMSNMLWQQSPTQQNLNFAQGFGRFNNVRAQYLTSIQQPNYPDSSNSLVQTSPQIINQTWNVQNIQNYNAQSGYNPKAPYSISFPTTITQETINVDSGTMLSQTLPTTCNMWGYSKPICSQFCKGTLQSMISATVPQCQMQNGHILSQKVPVSNQLFRVPLLSTICGILIPPQQFLLIPIQSLYNLLLQITLSKYAMFTSGYCDVHQYDKIGMSTMQPRKWLISQIYWNLHIYTFGQQFINRTIEASLVKSIPISATSYTLASQFQLPNGQVVRNSWPISSQAQSLCQVICLFLSNQYQQYTFCRKQFRLSNNISSMQIKFNTEFFPSQPIIGNAGNPQILDTTGDNWAFYQQILLSSNYLFNTNFPFPKINMKNFAINGRIYNSSNQSTYLNNLMYNNPTYTFTPQSVNADTALGMSNFHQNRYVGKAAFVYSWEPYGHSKNMMTGLNTQGSQNMNIIFNTVNVNPFPSDQTLLIFTRQNIIVIYTQNGVKVVGK